MQRLFLISVVSLLALAACESDTLWDACPFSSSIEAACDDAGTTSQFSCVVESHPFCDTSICAGWRGSAARCTLACDADVDCPSGSKCMCHVPGVSFCVLDRDLTEQERASAAQGTPIRGCEVPQP